MRYKAHQDTLRSAPSEATKKRRQRRSDKEEVTKRNPSQCSSKPRSRRVVGDLSPWHGRRCRGAGMVVDHGSFTPKKLHSTLFWPSLLSSKSLIIQVPYHLSLLSSKSLIIQVPYHPSPLLTKPHFSSRHQSRLFLLYPLSRLEGFFLDNIYTLWSFSFLPCLSHWLGGFSSIDPLSGFLPQFPTGLGGFSPATRPFKSHQLSYGARMFSVAPRLSSPVYLIGLGGCSLGSHSSLQCFHA